jgi:hypothetical protein
MPSPILQLPIGIVQTVTGSIAVANNAYANVADKLDLDNGTNNALMANFEITPVFGAAPVAGALQLYAVDWSLDGVTGGPAPSATMQPRLVGSFSPRPKASNAATTWVMRLNNVAVTNKTSYYVYNAATGQSVAIGWVLKAQTWSPGTA